MSIATLGQIGDLPPVHWVTHLGLWGHAPFTWVGSLLHTVFTQQTLQWTEGRWAWILISIITLGCAGFELVFWSWSWIRGRQIGYDARKARYWTSGPRNGQPKAKPIDLKKAWARSFAWPRVGLPLYLVAVGMFTWYLLWPGDASRTLLAVLWFAFTPLRRIMAIAAARKAYLKNNPGSSFDSTLFEDVREYFLTCVSRPPHKRQVVDPPFEVDKDTKSWRLYAFLNWGHATFGRYGAFWRVFRFWNVLRFWGVLLQLVVAFFWPIAAVVAPFYYMWAVEDYEDVVNPKWRAYRKSKYEGGAVPPSVNPAVS